MATWNENRYTKITSYQDTTKATILNEQFQSVFSRKSPNSLSSLCHMKLQESTDADRSMLDITVTSKGIEKLLSNLNPHKAADCDQIKPIILKYLSTPLSPIIKHLFQKSLNLGTLLPIWKDADVASVYKKGEHSNLANYRPISLTCILCKKCRTHSCILYNISPI